MTKLADNTQTLPPGALARSLTPHGDIAELALANMLEKLAPRLGAAGPRGARARVQKALNEAYARAQAAELDAGMARGNAAVLVAETLGEIICALALQATHKDPVEERIRVTTLFANIAAQMAFRMAAGSDDLAENEMSFVGATAPKPTRD